MHGGEGGRSRDDDELGDAHEGEEEVRDVVVHQATTRWTTTLSSKVNLPHVVNFMAKSVGLALTRPRRTRRFPRA